MDPKIANISRIVFTVMILSGNDNKLDKVPPRPNPNRLE